MENGNVIWSNKYDEIQKNIFQIQDEIVTKIINSMIGKIELSSLQRANRKPTENMTSYELTLKGRALNQKFDKEANAEAIRVLDAAIEADEDNPLPYSWKACTMGQALALGFQEQTDEFMGTFLESLNKGIELNDNDWNANRIMGEVHLTMHDFDQTKVFATKAYNANPNNSAVLSIYADALLRTDEIDEGINILEKAMRLDPNPLGDLNSDRWLNALFFANYLNKDYMRCKEILAEIQEFNLRTWLTNLDIAKSNNEEYENESWFEKGLKNFKDSDWMMEVDRFHLSDENTKNHLISIANSI
jgi:tetratricopeptide (TPR) repeat protein